MKIWCFLVTLVISITITACNLRDLKTSTPLVDSQVPPTPTKEHQALTTPIIIQASATMIPTETATPIPEIFSPAPIYAVLGDKTREDLASRTGLDIAMISVVEIIEQNWPDACLGLAPAENQVCIKSNLPGWRIVLNASGHTHEYRATADGSLISYSGPVGIYGPEACMIRGASLIYSPEDAYCLAYPVRFHRNEERGPIAIYGPTYGPGPEPLSAGLTVEISILADKQTLENAVEAFLAQLGEVPMPETRQEMTVAGEPAIMLEVVPGRLGSRDLFLVHHNRLFHLSFWPSPMVVVETAVDVEDLYQTVINSLNFQT